MCLLLLISGFAGCSRSSANISLPVVPVEGVVTLDGQPLPDADVTAIPVGATEGLGGSARTNAAGEFHLQHVRGEPGLPPGEYKFTVSLRKRPDGTVPPVNDPTPPIESDAVETLSAAYSSPESTTLLHAIPGDGSPLKLDLKAAGK